MCDNVNNKVIPQYLGCDVQAVHQVMYIEERQSCYNYVQIIKQCGSKKVIAQDKLATSKINLDFYQSDGSE